MFVTNSALIKLCMTIKNDSYTQEHVLSTFTTIVCISVVTVARWWVEKSTGENQREDRFFLTWYINPKKWQKNICLSRHYKCKQFQVSGFWNDYDCDFSSFAWLHYYMMWHLFILDLPKSCSLVKKLDFSLWKSWQSKHFVFSSADGVQSSNTDKKQAATRHSAPCGKLKCQTRKNLCIAYTQVNTHAHFFSPSLSLFSFFFSMKVFHTEDTHISESGREPPDTKMAKVHLINSWQARACSLWHRKWSD